jgi:hypothetical protein
MIYALLAVVWVAAREVSCSSEDGGLAPPSPSSSAAPQHFAYATLIGAVDILQRRSYMGPVANALIAARSLRDRGSKADFVAMVDFLDPKDQKKQPKEEPPPPRRQKKKKK